MTLADILNIILIENSWVFINLWTIVHLFSGFILIKYFLKGKKKRFIWLFGLLVLYELFELFIISTGSSLFRVEKNLDIYWDVIAGMVGGYLAR